MNHKLNRRTVFTICLLMAVSILFVGCTKKTPPTEKPTGTKAAKPEAKPLSKPSAKPQEKPAAAKAPAAQESTELDGTWVGQEVNVPGQWTLKISGKQLEGTGPKDSRKGNILLSTETNPKQADIVLLEGKDVSAAPQIVLGIYKIEANKLTLALGVPDSKQRPASFVPGSDVRVWNLTKK
jgi:uncharacterized protein (TIGR03067 family)